MSPKFIIVSLTWFVLSAVTVQAADWLPAKDAEGQAAEWLKKREGKLTLTYQAGPGEAGFKGSGIAGSTDTMYVLRTNDWWVTLGFKGTVQVTDTAAELSNRLKYIALDRMPTPGLEVKGWDIRPMTPVSSFREGIEIRSFAKGQVKVGVKSKCFCLYGRVKDQLLGPQPADAPLPNGSYFQLRQEIPLEISFEAPLGMTK